MKLDDLIIREATLDDIPIVARLHVDSWNKTYKGIIDQEYLNNMKKNIDKRIERMHNEFKQRKMMVAILNNEIVAFTEFTLNNEFSKELDIDCEFCGLYVKNEYVGIGIGSKFFDYIKSIFVKNGKHKMGLWCVKENENAIKFYIAKGGIQVKEKTFTLAGKEYNEVAFIYDL